MGPCMLEKIQKQPPTVHDYTCYKIGYFRPSENFDFNITFYIEQYHGEGAHNN